MSWGYKIAFLYLGFVALITTMIVLSMRERIDLVTADYYEQELHYQDRIDAIDRTTALREALTWELNGRSLLLRFPRDLQGRAVSGSIFFFRPSDQRMDQTMTIPPTASDSCILPLDNLHRGMYRMQISWRSGSTNYYNEGILQIP